MAKVDSRQEFERNDLINQVVEAVDPVVLHPEEVDRHQRNQSSMLNTNR